MEKEPTRRENASNVEGESMCAAEHAEPRGALRSADGKKTPAEHAISRRRMLAGSAVGAGLLAYTRPVIAQGIAGTSVTPVCLDDCGPGEGVGAVTPTATVHNDLTKDDIGAAALGLTRVSPADLKITGCVYLDGTDWKIRVLSASGKIHWGAKTPADGGYQEPVLPDNPSANITCANVQDAIDDMSQPLLHPPVDWHLLAAVNAHELNHVDWYQANSFGAAHWNPIETAIEGHVLGQCPPMEKAAAEAAMNAYLTTQINAWWANIYAGGAAPEGPAYAAGEVVLAPKRADLVAWKAANCPP